MSSGSISERDSVPGRPPGRSVRQTQSRPCPQSAVPSTSTSVRLDNPRPGVIRSSNEYVKVRKQPPSTTQPTAHISIDNNNEPRRTSWKKTNDHFDHPKLHTATCANSTMVDERLKRLGLGEIKPLVTCTSWKRSDGGRCRPVSQVVQTEQPRPQLPRPPNTGNIMCTTCGRCRCAACSDPRPLPSCYACKGCCLLSADNIVDALSCMCCVKGCLYHLHSIGREDDTGPQVTDADVCSCDSRGCCVRWTCLTMAGVCLPCMWCYLPLRGLAALIGSCYAKCNDNACTCDWRQEKGPAPGSATLPLPPSHRHCRSCNCAPR